MALTDAQKNAVNARGRNLIVSAAAGSGKTMVLVERVLALIMEGVNVDEMLIMTFTRAAAAEMRGRLRERLYRWSEEGGGEQAEDQLERLEYAQITTIDSFCTEIVRSYFELADCDPGYRILDEAQSEKMRDEALDEALENAYQNGIGVLGEGRDPKAVKALALTLAKFLDNRADPDKWCVEALALSESDGAVWKEWVNKGAKEILRKLRGHLLRALAIAKHPNGPYQYIEPLTSEIAMLDACIDMNFEDLKGTELTFTAKMPTVKAGTCDPDLKKAASDERTKKNELIKKYEKVLDYDFEASLADIRADIPAFKKLIEIVKDMNARLWEAKKEAGGMTFSDVEHRALAVLTDEDARKAISSRYRYVFVDEYQDTSDMQDSIVESVAGDRNLFMVGDVKQSIYRFRGAVPKLFQDKCRLYDEGGDNQRLVLGTNFRSSETVLAFINRIFKRVMNGGDSEIEYNEDEWLNYSNEFKGDTVPVEILITEIPKKRDEPEPEEDEDSPEKFELEGRLIARRIHELMTEVPGLKYGDICILSRSGRNFPKLAQVLGEFGIPAYTEKSDAFFDMLEIRLVMSLLRLVVSGRNELDILAVLRSPLFGMSTPDLANLRDENRLEHGFKPLWQAVYDSTGRYPACGRLVKIIEAARVRMLGMSLNRLIRSVIADTGLYAFAGALEGGVRRQGNLDMLCRRACQFEKEMGGTLAEFLEFAENLKENNDESGAHDQGEGSDVVRLMTDHKSKGLQFRVVFAMYLNKKRGGGKPGEGNELLLDRELGWALTHTDAELGVRRKTMAHDAIKRSNDARDLAEDLRVLYVALTRAKERLIMTGYVDDFEKMKQDWLVQKDDVDAHNTSLDIVCAAAVGCPGAEQLGGGTEKDAPEVRFTCVKSSELRMDSNRAEKTLEKAVSAAGKTGLTEMLAWEYPNAERPYAPVKLAVTGLEREFTGGMVIPEIHTMPEFMTGDVKRSPAGRGTAIHQSLRCMDYERLRAAENMEAEINAQLYEMAKDGRLLPEETEQIDPSEIRDFFDSGIGKRVLNADTVKREWSFCLRMPTGRVVEGYPADSEILVQGTIDLCFIEDGQWVLVDYKTSRTKDEKKLVERYSSQLNIYAEALETLTGIAVKEAVLCLTTARRTVSVRTERWHK